MEKIEERLKAIGWKIAEIDIDRQTTVLEHLDFPGCFIELDEIFSIVTRFSGQKITKIITEIERFYN